MLCKLWRDREEFGMVGGVKLYVLRERWGSLTESIREPDWPTDPLQDLDVALVHARYPGFYPWEDIPWDLPQSWAWELGKYFTLYGYRILGLRGLELFRWIKGMMTVWQVQYLLWVPIIKVAVAVMPILIIAGIAYWVNIEYTEAVTEEVFPQKYLMTYQERLWYADLVEVTEDGVGIYRRCKQAHAMRFSEHRNEQKSFGLVDGWQMGHTWVEIKSEFLKWRVWRWDSVWVEFIGMLYPTTYLMYQLKSGYTDPWVADVSPPWKKDPDDWCSWANTFGLPPI